MSNAPHALCVHCVAAVWVQTVTNILPCGCSDAGTCNSTCVLCVHYVPAVWVQTAAGAGALAVTAVNQAAGLIKSGSAALKGLAGLSSKQRVRKEGGGSGCVYLCSFGGFGARLIQQLGHS